MVQFGRWRDSFNSVLCSILSQSTLFQPVTARVISELYYKLSQSTFFQLMTAHVTSEIYYNINQKITDAGFFFFRNLPSLFFRGDQKSADIALLFCFFRNLYLATLFFRRNQEVLTQTKLMQMHFKIFLRTKTQYIFTGRLLF